MRSRDKRMSIELANKRLLGESINETHVDTDEGKIEYIKGALKNLSSEDLDKIYSSVEEYDPEYPKK